MVVVLVLVVQARPGAPFLLLPLLGILGFFVARAWVTANTYSVEADAAPAELALGDAFPWGVRLTAKRDLTLATATVTLRCQEHVVVRSGKSTAHYRKTVFEHPYRVAAQRLQAGQECLVRPQIQVPPNAVPSCGGHSHRIEWTVEVTIPTEGFSANVRRKATLNIAAKVAEEGAPDDRHVPLKWLSSAPILSGRAGGITPGGVVGASGEKLRGVTVIGEDVTASLQVIEGVASDHGPVVAAGTTRELRLIVEAQEPVHCRGLRVWIGCRLSGRGVTERIELFREEAVWSGDLAPMQPVETPIRLVVPRSGPVTYIGEHLRCDWLVRVRVDVPIWRDRVLELPFVVTPQAT
jgi:hypothetical protein